jgi:DNA-binding transcriptional regulator WhiA
MGNCLIRRLTSDQINEVIESAKAGRSLRKIAETLNANKTTVYYHARNYCRKMTKLDLTFLDDSEKGYIIGLFLGDGSLNRGQKIPRYIVRFALDAKRDQDIATRLVLIFEKSRKKVSVFPRENTLIVKVCSKELVEYIQTYIEYKANLYHKKEKKLLTHNDLSLKFQYGVLAGIIDSDGHVHKHLGTEIKTVSPSIFKEILNLLNNLGITAKTKRRRATEKSYSKKTCFSIYIPSFQMRTCQNGIPSVRIARFLQVPPSLPRKLN